MAFAAGQRIACYEIQAHLGAGGMADVYRAIDTRLQRTVAIKLLSNDLASETMRRRFQREAQAASSLNHPNIVTVHDVGDHAGRQYLVLEYVEGGTLRDWLRQEERSWRQVVELLMGVADGIATAHEAGVLHRDIKPDNILVSRNGHAKLADFGLAKLIEPRTGPPGTHLTGTGTVMGTVAYMSPEQAAGREMDARSDGFSFGVVLYEALGGCLPFAGNTQIELLHGILHEPARPLEVDVPIDLAMIAEKALEKEPADRYQSVREIAVDLRRALNRSARGVPTPAASGPAAVGSGGRPRSLVAVLGLFALGALGAGFWRSWPAAPPPELRLEWLTEKVGMEESPAISPSGAYVAFTARVDGRRQVWLRLVGKGEPAPITSGPAEHTDPRWVDDSTLVYYRRPEQAGQQGYVMQSLVVGTAQPRKLAPADGEIDVSRTSGRIVVLGRDAESAVLRIFDRDGAPIETIPLEGGASDYNSPRWSPDGREIAYQATRDIGRGSICVLDIASRRSRVILETGQNRGLAWLPDGTGLVYASADGSTLVYPPVFSLWQVDFDGSDAKRLPIGDAGHASYVHPDVMRDGRVAASRVQLQSDVYRFPVDGKTPLENTMAGERITWQTGQVQVPSVSPDGKRIAYLSNSGGHANVWVADVDVEVDGGEAPRQITFEDDPTTVIGLPLWSPEDDLIVYYRRERRKPSGELRLIAPDGTGDRFLVETNGGASWSHDGKWIYCMEATPYSSIVEHTKKIRIDDGTVLPVREAAAGVQVARDGKTGYFSPSTLLQGEIWMASPLETGTPRALRSDLADRIPVWPHHYHLSFDDRLLATPLMDEGTTNLWTISVEDGQLRQITDFGRRSTIIARQVSWSRDGKYIYAALLETDGDIVLVSGALR